MTVRQETSGFDAAASRLTGTTRLTGMAQRRARAEPARRRLAVSYGMVCALAGVAVAAWPRATLALAATLLGVQLTTHGVYRTRDALVARGAPAVPRLLVVTSSATSGVVGVICLVAVAGTVTALGALLATFFVTRVARPLISGWGRRDAGRAVVAERALDDVPMAFMTVVSVASGFVVLALPAGNAGVVTMVLGLWLVALGALGTFSRLRRPQCIASDDARRNDRTRGQH
jgi:uncharacterized membrane protein HdeD (DUF308 family)